MHIVVKITGLVLAITVVCFSRPASAAACSFSLSQSSAGTCDVVDVTNGLSGTISNAGTIGILGVGNGVVVRVGGTITTLNNLASGVIRGDWAIDNSGTITTFNNAGSIQGNNYGFLNWATLGTLNNSGTISATAGRAIVLLNNSTTSSLVNTGTIQGSVGQGISIQDSASVGTLRNDGQITGPDVISLFHTSSLQEFLNNGTLTSTQFQGFIISSSGVSVGSVINNGTINGVTQGVNVYRGSLTLLRNNAGATIQANNEAVKNEDRLTTLENSGSILGVTHYGVGVYSPITTLTNNAGGVIYGPLFGIYVSGSGSIGTMTNGQGGDGSSRANTALTYSGALPGSYYIQVSSGTLYGQLSVTSASGSMNVGVQAASGTALKAGTYQNVLSGVTSANLGNTSGTVSTQSWRLVYDGVNYDLVVGMDSANTRASLVSHGNVARRLLAMRGFAANAALSYDCNSFSANGYCLSFQAGYVGMSDQSEGSGVLILSKQIGSGLRLGGFLDLRGVERDTTSLKYADARPMAGVFVGYTGNDNGTGMQARLSALTHVSRVTLQRDSSLANTEAGKGEANVSSRAFAGHFGYGFAMGGYVVTPKAGLRHLSTTRGAYQEVAQADYPISFASLTHNSTSAMTGVSVGGNLVGNLLFEMEAGAEWDLGRRSSNVNGTSAISDLTSFSIPAANASSRVRIFAKSGFDLAMSDSSAATVRLAVQSLPFTSQAGVSALAGYRRAF